MNRINLGATVIRLDNVDSTNSYLSRLLHDGKPDEGTVILADFQSAGKGQAGSVWESKAGQNLTLSFLLYPHFMKIGKQFNISMCISNAIVQFLNRYKLKSMIKWPNDILVNDRKIAGILTENTVLEQSVRSSIIGIGLNVNQKEFAPGFHATSLSTETGYEMDLNALLTDLLNDLENWTRYLYEQEFVRIRIYYLNHLSGLNTWMYYKNNSGSFEGRIIDITEAGQLMVKTRDGDIRYYTVKEIWQ